MARVVCFLFPLVNNWLISWFERLRHLIRWFLKWDVPLVLDPLSILLQCRQIAAKVSPLLTLSKSFHTTDFNLLELTITASSVISITSQLDLINKGNANHFILQILNYITKNEHFQNLRNYAQSAQDEILEAKHAVMYNNKDNCITRKWTREQSDPFML